MWRKFWSQIPFNYLFIIHILLLDFFNNSEANSSNSEFISDKYFLITDDIVWIMDKRLYWTCHQNPLPLRVKPIESIELPAVFRSICTSSQNRSERWTSSCSINGSINSQRHLNLLYYKIWWTSLLFCLWFKMNCYSVHTRQ